MLPRIPSCSLLLSIAVATALFAVSPSQAQTRGGTLIYSTVAGPASLDPYMAGSLVELEIIHEIFETLVAMDENYNAKPMLASKVDVSNEAKTFTFTLRKGVKFSNGQEMTSADVLGSFERFKKVSTNAPLLADVEKYETPDPYTFVVHLKSTNAVFVDLLKSSTYPLVVLPASQKDKPAREVEIIGTGPFKLGEWQKDSHLILLRNDGYSADESAGEADGFAGKKTAYLDSVRYNFIPEANARLAALQTKKSDVIADLTLDLAKRLEGISELSTLKTFPYCQQYFVLHASNGLTANPLIRQAIREVVNVDDILAATGILSQRNPSLLYPPSPYYAGDMAAKFYDRKDPKKAKEILKQAGYNGEKLVLQTNSNYPYMRDSILVLSEQLKEAGVNADVQVIDWMSNSNNLQRGTGNWNVSTTSFCSPPLLGPQQWKSTVYTFPHIDKDPAIDAAFDSLFKSVDEKTRKTAWFDIENRFLDQAYMVKVADTGSLRGYNNTRVGGLKPYFYLRFWNTWLK
jgi:peptide/nickel transport system substrate-binding protein